MTDTNDDRWAQGLASYLAVYGDDAVVFPQGQSDMFDLMIRQLFGEVWTRDALPIPVRRLLTIGVLAAQHRADILQIQWERALRAGELTVEQVRESVIHLIAYVGYPASADLLKASEAAIDAAAAEVAS